MSITDPRAVVLVEGVSDRFALEVLARRRGRDLDAERVAVLAMDGATNIARFLDRYGPAGLDLRVAGLYDSAEERFFRRGLERAGFEVGPATADLEKLGFFVCSADLEDELIRAVGADQVLRIIDTEGELRSFRTMQRQPAHRDRSLHEQLHRVLGARSGWKQRYARLMAEAVDLGRVPRPLDAVLEYIRLEHIR
jgi:hypothetical protein